jgi:NAD(P)H-hydrate epimerase
VYVRAAEELMAQDGLGRVLLLCAKTFESMAKLAAEQLGSSEKQADIVLIEKDELPDLSGSLICDLLFESIEEGSLLEKRRGWIEAITGSGCPVVSAAIPAGVDPDTGRAQAKAVQAKITVSPVGYLPGLFLHDGLDHCGEIRPIGGETETTDGLFRFEDADAKRLLPPRKRTAHKGDSGKALLCVGSPRYVGAALLSARACLAAGCGILFVACPDEVRAALRRLPEAIGIPVGSDWNRENCRPAIRAMAEKQALGIGCGVGDGDVSPLLEAALKTGLPLVLDADGLNCLSRRRELFSLLHEKVVLTPHPGEMGRLTGLPVRRVLEDPLSLADEFAHLWGCTVLLKGAATVVSDGKRTRLVAEGNAGLGKGGSGDVLTGIITGLLSQGTEPFTAACLGSYLLGASADRAFALLKERMLRATNVIEALEDWNE